MTSKSTTNVNTALALGRATPQAVGVTAVPIVLQPITTNVSLFVRNAAIRLKVYKAPVTALDLTSTNYHFIDVGERFTFSCDPNTIIAMIRDATAAVDALVEISELTI